MTGCLLFEFPAQRPVTRNHQGTEGGVPGLDEGRDALLNERAVPSRARRIPVLPGPEQERE